MLPSWLLYAKILFQCNIHLVNIRLIFWSYITHSGLLPVPAFVVWCNGHGFTKKWLQFNNKLWCLILLEIFLGILSDSRWTDANPGKGWGNKGYSTGTEWKTWASRGRAILVLFSLLGVYTSRNILALSCIQNKIHVTCQPCHEQENKGGSTEKNKLVKWKGKLIFGLTVPTS